MKYVIEYFQALVELTNEMSPYLLLGFLFAGILHVFFPDEKINRMLGANNFKSVFKAALIGMPLPLCSCGVIPTGISFFKHGASKGSTVSFLISTPQTGVDSILVTYSLIGLPFAIIRVIVALVTGLLGGIFTNLFVTNELKVAASPSAFSANDAVKPKLSFTDIFKYAFFDFIKDIAKWLVIGLLIAAFITVIIPDDFFTNYLHNSVISMLVILIASIPLYVCATGSVPIAAALLMKGLSPGAALVFLMAGPATNAATITVIGKVMGRKSLISYLGSIIAGALVFGFLIDAFIDPAMLTGFMQTGSTHVNNHEILPHWFQIGCSILLVAFIANSFLQDVLKNIKRKQKKNKPNNPVIEFNNLIFTGGANNIIVSVKGMNCNHCKLTVEGGLKQHDDIKSIIADVDNETVTLTGENIDLSKVKETVESLGYKYGGKMER